MFEKKQPDIQDESVPPRLELSEVPGLVLSFLWFYRGVFLAFLVLLALYYVLTLSKRKVAAAKRRDRQAPAFVPVPQPVENKSLAGGGLGSSEYVKPTTLPTERMPLVKRPSKKIEIRSEDPATIRFKNFVSTADANSLLQRSKALLKQVPKLSPTDAVTNITRRQWISARMRTMELTSDQEEQLTIDELESLSQLDAINVQHNMEIPGLRNRLLELATSLSHDTRPNVAVKAHLAFVAARGIDLLIDPTRSELQLLTEAYQAHIDQILEGAGETVVTATLLQKIVERHQFDEVIELARDLVRRVLSQDSSAIRNSGVAEKERVIFGDLGLPTLLSRMDGVSPEVHDDITAFYQRLKNFPEAGKPVFQVAVAIIGKHMINKQNDHAARSLDWLQQIHPDIADPETRNWVGESLEQYSEKLNFAQVEQ